MPTVKLSNACSVRGASLGRRDSKDIPLDAEVKFSLVRIPLDMGGYDNGGAYWGHGNPLYRAYAHLENGLQEAELWFRVDRTKSGEDRRNEAKAAVRKIYPNAKFYR